jgi:probable O-glycosylation ligase (exosortase A-associated)
MLRLIFVAIIIIVGTYWAFQGAFYALLFYLWNAYFRPEAWVWSPIVSQLNLSFIIGVYLVAVTLLSFQQFVLNTRVILLLLFFAQATLSTILSENPELSWFYWTEFSKALLVSYLIVVLVTDLKRFRLFLVVIGLSLGFEAAKQGWAVWVLYPGASNQNTHPFLGDNNGVAMGMMMLVPLLSALAQTSTKRWHKYLFAFFAVGVFMRGLSTYSRGGFLCAGVVGLFYLIRSPNRLKAIVIVLVVASVALPVMPDKFWDRMSTITAPSEERDYSARGRLHYWLVAREMIQAKPFTGVGFNAFRSSYIEYDPSGGYYGTERATHSAWFGMAAENGLPGLLLFVALLAQVFWTTFRIRRFTKSRPEFRQMRLFAAGLETSLSAYVAGATFLSAQYNEMTWHLLGASIALAAIHAKVVAASPVHVRVAPPFSSVRTAPS